MTKSPMTRYGVTKQTIQRRRAKWLKALEDGERPQVRGALAKKQKIKNGKIGYCCLGVACDLLGLKAHPYRTGEDSRILYSFGDMHSTSYLPIEAKQYYGLTSNDPRINFPSGMMLGTSSTEGVLRGPTTMSRLNDALRWDFKRIAAAVREYGFYHKDDGIADL